MVLQPGLGIDLKHRLEAVHISIQISIRNVQQTFIELLKEFYRKSEIALEPVRQAQGFGDKWLSLKRSHCPEKQPGAFLAFEQETYPAIKDLVGEIFIIP